jgi:hypothetical protein
MFENNNREKSISKPIMGQISVKIQHIPLFSFFFLGKKVHITSLNFRESPHFFPEL